MRRAFVLSWSIQLLLAAGVHAANLPSGTTAPPTEPGFVGLGSNSPYTATTAGQFAAACKIDQASCAAMIGNVLMDRIQFSPTSHICLPDITYGNAVGPWLAAHPETANMSVEDGVFLAITTLYKCGAPNNY